MLSALGSYSAALLGFWKHGNMTIPLVFLTPRLPRLPAQEFQRLNEGRSIEQFIWTVQYFYPHSILKMFVLSGFSIFLHGQPRWTANDGISEIYD